MMRRPSHTQYGGTLIEALIAMVIVSVATASITNLLKHVADANRRMSFQTAALDVYAEVVAQIDDARCNVDLAGAIIRDPGLDAIIAARPNFVRVANGGSLIRTVGVLNAQNPAARSVPLIVGIRDVTPAGWVPGASLGPPTLDFEIEIREITGDGTRDNLAVTNGFWIRTYPAKKVCNFRVDGNGRGEAY